MINSKEEESNGNDDEVGYGSVSILRLDENPTTGLLESEPLLEGVELDIDTDEDGTIWLSIEGGKKSDQRRKQYDEGAAFIRVPLDELDLMPLASRILALHTPMPSSAVSNRRRTEGDHQTTYANNTHHNNDTLLLENGTSGAAGKHKSSAISTTQSLAVRFKNAEYLRRFLFAAKRENGRRRGVDAEELVTIETLDDKQTIVATSEGGAATASASPPPNKRVKPTSTPTTTNGPNIIATNNGPTTTAALSSSSSVSASSSEFDTRTEAGSAAQYFQFYAYLCQQQNMMQDYTRTATYQRAILDNAAADFNGRVVLDVGAGSGILSFFAAQAGARRVYAVEASSMAAHCEALVAANDMRERIKVIAAKVEECELDERVDVIISEPMGYMLVNERMLESFIHARRFLKPGGRMFPTRADLHFALFSDNALYLEQDNFHGVNLTALSRPAFEEIFSQPVVDTWSIGILISHSVTWSIDFERDSIDALRRIDVPFRVVAERTCFLHGIASWFDVAFNGSTRRVWLSTAPTEPLTHWYQVRCLLREPLMVHAGEIVRGRVLMTANDRQSYEIHVEAEVEKAHAESDGGAPTAGGGSDVDETIIAPPPPHRRVRRSENTLDLKTPHFRYGAGGVGASTLQQPGAAIECPSEKLHDYASSIHLHQQEQQRLHEYLQQVSATSAVGAAPSNDELLMLVESIPVPRPQSSSTTVSVCGSNPNVVTSPPPPPPLAASVVAASGHQHHPQ